MSLPAPDLLIAAMRRSGVIASSASVRVQTGTWATVVHADESTWILREIPTPAPVSILSLDREIEARSPDIGLAVAPAPDGTVWRLDRETEVKDLLGHLARGLGAGAGSADAMATVLALFQSGGPGERALLRPPELIGGLGIRNAILSAMHAPRLAATGGGSVDAVGSGGSAAPVGAGEGSLDGDWSLVFWSLASVPVEGAPIRSVLHRWTVTSRAGEVTWWSRPEWASS